MYGKYGDIDAALSHYMKVVEESGSTDVIKRVTKLALKENKNESAMVAVKRWIELDPASVDAHQYLA